MAVVNALLLIVEALVYFGVMATLFRARHRYGIGLFMCALGVMHFLETYLAAVFYIPLPFGVISPGSTVLFSGKLIMLLLLYIREDASTVRQPIYGLFVGNLLIVSLVVILRQHEMLSPGGRAADLAFLDEMGLLMIWGTTLLLIDGIAIILLYERLGQLLRSWTFLRIFLSAGLVLAFDQVGFFMALHYLYDAPVEVFIGGLVAKIGAAFFFSALVTLYLKWFEWRPERGNVRLADVFDTLTYRERYEALLKRSAIDPLTGLLNREQFERIGPEAADAANRTGAPLSLLIIDADRFKSINDRFGHPAGDQALAIIGAELAANIRQGDLAFRYGGEEFLVLCKDTKHAAASLLAERLRLAVKTRSAQGAAGMVTISAGVATLPEHARTLDELIATADRRLFAAKDRGRDQVVCDDDPQMPGTNQQSARA
ncbi:MAG: GGDEF domain-containing protein [Rhizobiales bacterium]|nr:GGDEF domain-containing protein [Hyphomicrobiales bacterium]